MRKPARLPPDQLEPYLLPHPADPAVPPAPIEWRAAFGNDHPVEIEVGSGKGLFLLTSAQAHPDINYLGVEIERKYQLFAATRIAKRGLSNVRLACADARQFLRDRVTTASVQAIHVYFPDPWWKTRHHKRRVVTAEFVGQCERIIRPGGRLHVATDVEDYFRVISGLVAAVPTFRVLPPPAEHEPAHDLDYLTNFERKARQKGQPVYRAVYERREGERGA